MEFDELGKSLSGEVELDEMRVQTPSIKITKNSKGYNYEFKILTLEVNVVDEIHNQLEVLIKKWTSTDKS